MCVLTDTRACRLLHLAFTSVKVRHVCDDSTDFVVTLTYRLVKFRDIVQCPSWDLCSGTVVTFVVPFVSTAGMSLGLDKQAVFVDGS